MSIKEVKKKKGDFSRKYKSRIGSKAVIAEYKRAVSKFNDMKV